MKIIVTEQQAKSLLEQIADSPLDMPLNDNPLYQLKGTLEKDAPNLVKFARSMSDNSLGGTINKISNLSSAVKGQSSNQNPAPDIPEGNQMMHPLGHKLPISSNFGYRNTGIPGATTNHKGVDIPTPSGSPIYAPLDGLVIASRDTTPNACGGFIQLSHTDVKTKFCHLSKMIVHQGDKVKKGEIIGYSGGGANDPMHGLSTGPHLHYEILNRTNMAMNPVSYEPNLA